MRAKPYSSGYVVWRSTSTDACVPACLRRTWPPSRPCLIGCAAMSPDIRRRAHVCRTVARNDLRNVLGLSARETANVLETTPVSIDSALLRSHKTVDDRLSSHSHQQPLRHLG